ncbi:MAG: pantoate--beta-alanine ligase [Verrucomicrobiota bacterium]|nr:pantoate--beta-alanine ligase [Verrucomicrobiota bacterium]
MKTITESRKMQRQAIAWRKAGRRVVLVPTMGALHDGHRRLINMARKKVKTNGIVVVSIYVNPKQFNDPKDLKDYPRTLSADKKLCREESVDMVFAPNTLYEKDVSVGVKEDDLSTRLEGLHRPGHFAGVMAAVANLFNLVLPDFSVFGEKDFQQATVIKRMVRDLNYPVSILVGPTVREADGLAMSSRNVLLTGDLRDQAAVLSRAIELSRQSLGSRAVDIKRKLKRFIEKQPDAQVDYIEFVDTINLNPIKTVNKGSRILLAAKIGPVRLIDNGLL